MSGVHIILFAHFMYRSPQNSSKKTSANKKRRKTVDETDTEFKTVIPAGLYFYYYFFFLFLFFFSNISKTIRVAGRRYHLVIIQSKFYTKTATGLIVIRVSIICAKQNKNVGFENILNKKNQFKRDGITNIAVNARAKNIT